jgi:hypothetical protein
MAYLNARVDQEAFEALDPSLEQMDQFVCITGYDASPEANIAVYTNGPGFRPLCL